MLRQDSTAPLVEEIPETPFYIPATGSSTRPRRTLKHGDCFAVLDSYADIGASAGGPDGIFFCDTRHLSHLEMLLNGKQPLLLGSSVRDDNSILTVDLTNPDIYLDQKLVLPKDVLHVVRTLFLWRGTAYQRLRIQNHGDRPFEVRLTLAFASDFADLFEVRGLRRARRGTATAEISGETGVTLNYQGLDGNRRRTMLLFEPAPERLSTGAAVLCVRAAAQRIPVDLCDGEMRPRRRRKPPAAVSQGPARRVPGAPDRKPRHGHHHHLEPDLQRGDVPLDGRPRDPDDRHAGGSLSLRRHPLVLDHVRPRRDHHRDADAVVRFPHRQRRAAAARRLSGQRFRSARRRRARENPARDARRRNGGAAGGSVRPVLRQRGCDAAVRDAGRALHRAHRRHRDAARALAQHRSGARLDRRTGRSRSRRLRRISPRRRERPGQPGLEGLPRRDLPCRWFDRARADRAVRGAGLRLCGEARWRRAARAAWQARARRRARCAGDKARRTVRGGVLVRGHRHLCARARRPEAAVPRADLERRAGAVQRNCRARSAPQR